MGLANGRGSDAGTRAQALSRQCMGLAQFRGSDRSSRSKRHGYQVGGYSSIIGPRWIRPDSVAYVVEIGAIGRRRGSCVNRP